MKSRESTIYQIIFQSVGAMVTVILFVGMGALFVNGGTSAFEHSLENLETARDLLTNLAS
jgi:hypothetical protein